MDKVCVRQLLEEFANGKSTFEHIGRLDADQPCVELPDLHTQISFPSQKDESGRLNTHPQSRQIKT